MKRYKDFQPTGFDPKGLGLENRQEWFVAPVIQTRDSGPLDKANFEACLEQLGGEGKNVEVHRFNHWGPGWFELILVYPLATAKVKKLDEIESGLADYPVIDEEKLSKLELTLIDNSYDTWAKSDAIETYQKFLKLPSEDCEIEVNEDEFRSHVIGCIECNGDDCIYRNSRFEHVLKTLKPMALWSMLDKLTISREDFENLPHETYHLLFQCAVTIIDYDTGEDLYVPDFISVQYDPNQMKLFPS